MTSYYDRKPWLATYPGWLPDKLALPAVSLLDEFLQSAAAYPDDPCVHYFERTFSYREIRRMAQALAAALEKMGLAARDRVIVVMQNIPQAVVAIVAVWMRRAVVVPLNPMYTGQDLKHYLADSGGAPVAPGTVAKFREAMGIDIYNVYGLTESCSPATITPLGLEGPVDAQSGALSVGLVVPGHDAWIMDLENPAFEMPPGQEGELVLRGPGITDGYWEKPQETANAIRNGRLHTGDVAKIDENGWCFIVDRKKDLINASGFKVWPREVEDVLNQHPGVREAAVVGVPDAYRGETVKAFVALTDEYRQTVTPEDLIRFCKERMAAYKYPRIVEIIDEVPKTLTGKYLRRRLREV